MLKAEDITFWILILAVISMVIWLAFGSLSFENGFLVIAILIAGSEILLWRALFTIDKRTAVGFERVKLDFERVNNKLGNMENKLANIEDNIAEIKNGLVGIKKSRKRK